MSPNCAGVILYCVKDGAIKTCLLKNKFGDHNWGFPKGHIEKKDGDDYIQTALRETEEETGFSSDDIHIDITCLGDPYTFETSYKMIRATKKIPTGVKNIVFYLGRLSETEEGSIPEPTLSREHTEIGWYSIKQTLDLLPRSLYPVFLKSTKCIII